MTTVSELCRAMEAWAPPGWAYSWDKSGLCIGSPNDPVKGVLVCLTVTEEAYKAAKRAGASMIISHHPLIWEPLQRLNVDNPHCRLCLKLAEEKIACYSAHTNLDLAPQGVNHVLAECIGLKQLSPLVSAPHVTQVKLTTFVPTAQLQAVRQALGDAGAGKIGAYSHCAFSSSGTGTFLPGAASTPFSGEKGAINEVAEERLECVVDQARLKTVLTALFESHPYEEVAYDIVPLQNRAQDIGLGLQGVLDQRMALDEFAEKVRSALHRDHVRVIGAARKKVRKVGVLGGAGGSEVTKIAAKLDVLVTGDVKYHDALHAQEKGLALIDAGHAGTELPVVSAMTDYLRQRFSAIKIASYREADLFRALKG